MIHIHARKPDGTPSFEIEDYKAITEAIKAEAGDVIINYSTGAMGVSVEKRIAYLRELRPDVAALNMGSMNYAKYSKRRKEFVFSFVFENSFNDIIHFVEAMNALGIRPEHECFELGHIGSLLPLIDMGLLEQPLLVNCVMGVLGGAPATGDNLAHPKAVPAVVQAMGVEMAERCEEIRHADAAWLGRAGPRGDVGRGLGRDHREPVEASSVHSSR